ncbi:MAG: class I adenylate-forming enzyme family protein [Desulfobacteria bacterium]
MITLTKLLERAVKLVPQKPLIIYNDNIITYREFDRLTSKVANGLSHLGLKKRDCIAYFLPNTPLIAVCDFGIQKIGAVAVPINSMAKSKEVKHIINNTDVKAILTDQNGYEIVSEVRGQLPHLEHVIIQSDEKPDDALAYNDIMEKASDQMAAVQCDPDDVVGVLYTSGTTGAPKGTMQTQKSLFYGITHMASSHKFRFGRENFLCPMPLFNNFGRTISLMGAINNCGTLVLLERWDTDMVLRTMTEWNCTYFGGTPTMFIYLMDGFKPDRHQMSLRMAFVAGAKCPLDVIEEFNEKFSHVALVEGYGATELCGFVTTNPLIGVRKLGSVGVPIGDVEIQILSDDLQKLGPGETGEVVVETDMKSKGYWNDLENTQFAFREQGWFSGDVGYLDEDGYLYLMDRKKDLIIRGGANIFPVEVEETLHSHPKVKMAAVIGIPDHVKGELPKAYVVLHENEACTEQELIQYCREKMAVYKVPVAVEFRAELPLNAVGKILRRTLRDQVLKEG